MVSRKRELVVPLNLTAVKHAHVMSPRGRNGHSLSLPRPEKCDSDSSCGGMHLAEIRRAASHGIHLLYIKQTPLQN